MKTSKLFFTILLLVYCLPFLSCNSDSEPVVKINYKLITPIQNLGSFNYTDKLYYDQYVLKTSDEAFRFIDDTFHDNVTSVYWKGGEMMMIGASTYVESNSYYDYSFIGNKIDVKIKEYENKFVVELLVKQTHHVKKGFARFRGKEWYWCIIPMIHKPMEVVEVLDMDNY